MTDFLTTRELAELLRIKERKVYDLAATGSVPCTKAMGKLLFPRDEIQAWLSEHRTGPAVNSTDLPVVFLGSHDPLLDWAIRESGCGIATWFDGSKDGLDRFVSREGIATGLHIYNANNDNWNSDSVEKKCLGMPVTLVEWATRSRGLVLPQHHADTVKELTDIADLRIASRQPSAGAQETLIKLLDHANIVADSLNFTEPQRSENDAILAVLEGKADVTFGLEALANQYQLMFIPIINERFDLVVNRHAWFEPPFQSLLEFTRDTRFKTRATELKGYDIARLGTVHLNLKSS